MLVRGNLLKRLLSPEYLVKQDHRLGKLPDGKSVRAVHNGYLCITRDNSVYVQIVHFLNKVFYSHTIYS